MLRVQSLGLARRKRESEADMIGMDLAARACFDPSAAVTFFRRKEALEREMGDGGEPEYLRTHPVSKHAVGHSTWRL